MKTKTNKEQIRKDMKAKLKEDLSKEENIRVGGYTLNEDDKITFTRNQLLDMRNKIKQEAKAEAKTQQAEFIEKLKYKCTWEDDEQVADKWVHQVIDKTAKEVFG